MSELGDFNRKQMRMEIEREERDMEPDGFERFFRSMLKSLIGIVIFCVIAVLIHCFKN